MPSNMRAELGTHPDRVPVGARVRYRDPGDDGEAMARYIVLEDRGDRALLQWIDADGAWASGLIPTCVRAWEDLCAC